MSKPSVLLAPVAVFYYNRPEKLKHLWTRLSVVKPHRVYLIADGPDSNKPGDFEQCILCSEVVGSPDWPCEVFRLERPCHLGCRKSVINGLNWVFSIEECAIILEDDCIPAITFFRFATELLHRYANQEKVMAISGRRIHAADEMDGCSYDFSRYALKHGWATWARTIHSVDWDLEEWDNLRNSPWLAQTLGHPRYIAFWSHIFDRMKQGWDTWDYAVAFSMMRRNGLCVVPAVNLVENIGYDAEGSNTVDVHPGVSDRTARDIQFPLRHPDNIVNNTEIDDRIEWMVHSGLLFRQLSIAQKRILSNRKSG